MNARRSFIFWSLVLLQVALFNAAVYALRLGLWPLAALCLGVIVGTNLWALGRLRHKH